MSKPGLNAVVAGNIRKLRQAKGWSQDELAARSGLHRTYVGAIERSERNITLETLERLADALSIPAVTLLRGKRK